MESIFNFDTLITIIKCILWVIIFLPIFIYFAIRRNITWLEMSCAVLIANIINIIYILAKR